MSSGVVVVVVWCGVVWCVCVCVGGGGGGERKKNLITATHSFFIMAVKNAFITHLF